MSTDSPGWAIDVYDTSLDGNCAANAVSKRHNVKGATELTVLFDDDAGDAFTGTLELRGDFDGKGTQAVTGIATITTTAAKVTFTVRPRHVYAEITAYTSGNIKGVRIVGA